MHGGADFGCTLGRLGSTAGNLARRCTLLFHRAGHSHHLLGHFPDQIANLPDRFHSLIGVGLNRVDLGGYLLRRLPCLRRQVLHLRRDDCEALTRIPGPRRLNGSIQGEKVGLFRDVGNQLHHLADLLRIPVKVLNDPVRVLRRAGGHLGHS